MPILKFKEISIVTGSKPSGPEKTAASMIREKILKESGLEVPIVTEGKKSSSNKDPIIIGTPDSCKLLLGMQKPRYDGFSIYIQDERIILLGGIPRGTLYAAEKFLGSVKIDTDGFYGILSSNFPRLQNFTQIYASESRWPKYNRYSPYPCQEFYL